MYPLAESPLLSEYLRCRFELSATEAFEMNF